MDRERDRGRPGPIRTEDQLGPVVEQGLERMGIAGPVPPEPLFDPSADQSARCEGIDFGDEAEPAETLEILGPDDLEMSDAESFKRLLPLILDPFE